MFCHNCGKEIADGINFCPYCGKTQEVSNKIMNNEPSGAVDNTLSSAKNIGNQVKAVVEDKAQAYVDMAKETAQDFVNDVQQVTKDKDTDNFFKKNNNRNTKIILVIAMAMVILFMLFGGNPKGSNEAIKIAEEHVTYYNDVTKLYGSDIDLVGKKDGESFLLITVNTKTKDKDKMYHYIARVSDKGEVLKIKATSTSSDQEHRKEVIKLYREAMKKDGYK
ncbi:zinc ribbon domain-containing protein [Anaerovibrio sp. RM50]|uniref:zinc ribbon domain-containing protein n=1 Tax=Anaerovibrio sp. RM50 TaxID=1200557 RepID=UPI000487235F|nr:zinc ribbon domain-containing protein [Anaerovibrio sp. RM50]